MNTLIRAALGFHLRRRIHHVILYVTERCPLRCRTCFVGTRAPAPDPRLEDVAPFLRALGPVTMVDLGGGEPFLRDDLPDWCALFPKAGNIGIPTSGWDTEVVRRVEEVLAVTGPRRLTISVSLDGFRETNDAVRGRGTFDRALATLRALAALPGLQVKVNTVLTRENAGELIEFMRFIRSEAPLFHSILLLRGDPRDAECRLPALAEVERLVPAILDIQRSYHARARGLTGRVGRNYPRLLWGVSLAALRDGRQAVPCLAGRAHLVIYANGDVAPCELLPPVGNIHRDAPEAILKGDALRAAVRAIRAGQCACTHNCNMVENILFNPRTCLALLTGRWAAFIFCFDPRPPEDRET